MIPNAQPSKLLVSCVLQCLHEQANLGGLKIGMMQSQKVTGQVASAQAQEMGVKRGVPPTAEEALQSMTADSSSCAKKDSVTNIK
jgi:hypothetical protein